MRAALFSCFPSYFLERKILPELRRRGVEVVLVDDPKRCESVDLSAVELVLHMVEMGGHSHSFVLSKVCRLAGIPVRALSRKTASWDDALLFGAESGKRSW